MTRQLGRTAVSAVLALSVVFGTGVVASAQPAEANSTPPLLHPCDVSNDNGKLDTALERLCMRVWGQDAYTVSDKNGDVRRESPAGPAVVVELVDEWIDEDAGIIWLKEEFRSEREMYADRDR